MALSASSSTWFQSWNPPTSLLSQFNSHDHDTNFKFFHINHDTGQTHEESVVPLAGPNLGEKSPLNSHHQQSNGNRGSERRYQDPHGNNNHYFRKTFHPPLQKQQSMVTFLPYLISVGMLGHNSHLSQADADVPDFIETTGPFRTWYKWGELDFAFPSFEARASAIDRGDFVPANNLPLGIEVYKDRIFVSMPKWKNGVPCTLAVLPRLPREESPPLVPYPNWDWHHNDDCDVIVSVYRMQADSCGRLWVLDSGQIQVTIDPRQICPPKVLIFDLNTDQLIKKYVLPKEFIKQDGLFSNIVVDVKPHDCNDAYAYLTDVWRYGIVVYSLHKNRSWRIYDHLFMPDPLAAAYTLHDLEFEWSDGIFGMALSAEETKYGDRIMYFHPMSSFREFYTKTSVIKNETGWGDIKNAFKVIGQSRGKSGHVSASGMDRNGVLFYNLVTRDSIGCWDTRKPYKRDNLGLVAKSNVTLIFPNDLKLDNDERQSVWVLTNRLPYYLYKELDPTDYNFRIMSAYTDEAIRGTICDPRKKRPDTFVHYPDGEDCY